MLEVTDNDFKQEVLQSPLPVLVDFWAPWCGPCKMIAPVLEEIAQQLAGKVKVVKVNIEENPQTPSELGVRSIPTLMLFAEGALIATKIGAIDKQLLLEWIAAELKL
jgi:thioredoxin 1